MLTHKTREPLHVTSMSAKHEFYTKLVQVAIVAMNQFFLASNGLFAIFLVSSSKVDSISISRGGIFEQANPILDLSSLDALVVIGSFLL